MDVDRLAVEHRKLRKEFDELKSDFEVMRSSMSARIEQSSAEHFARYEPFLRDMAAPAPGAPAEPQPAIEGPHPADYRFNKDGVAARQVAEAAAASTDAGSERQDAQEAAANKKTGR